MTYTSQIGVAIAKLHRGIDKALLAAVTIPMEATRADLAQGFTTGDSTSGESAASVKADGPKGDYQYGRYIRYGTELFYHRFWTLGGMNIYTRQWERVDKWTPRFYESQGKMLTAAQAALRAEIG